MGRQAGIYDDFAAAVAERASRFKQGGGLDPTTTLGPLISEAAVTKVGRCPFWDNRKRHESQDIFNRIITVVITCRGDFAH